MRRVRVRAVRLVVESFSSLVASDPVADFAAGLDLATAGFLAAGFLAAVVFLAAGFLAGVDFEEPAFVEVSSLSAGFGEELGAAEFFSTGFFLSLRCTGP